MTVIRGRGRFTSPTGPPLILEPFRLLCSVRLPPLDPVDRATRVDWIKRPWDHFPDGTQLTSISCTAPKARSPISDWHISRGSSPLKWSVTQSAFTTLHRRRPQLCV